jgi:hypothetical protein
MSNFPFIFPPLSYSLPPEPRIASLRGELCYLNSSDDLIFHCGRPDTRHLAFGPSRRNQGLDLRKTRPVLDYTQSSAVLSVNAKRHKLRISTGMAQNS